MKGVPYSKEAAQDLKTHGHMASRVHTAIAGYAAGQGAHANNVTLLVGSPYSRLRVGDFRVIFQEDATTMLVLKIRPRGGAYD